MMTRKLDGSSGNFIRFELKGQKKRKNEKRKKMSQRIKKRIRK